MPMPVWPFGEPVTDGIGFMARRIVHDGMYVEAGRDVIFDLVKELAVLLGAITRHARTDYGAWLDLRRALRRSDEARKERGRAVAVVIVRAPLDLSGTHREQRLRAVQSLDLALLVDADDKRLVRRIEIEADDVAHLFDELRIGRELERLRAVRLQRESPPDPMYRR